MNKVYLLLFGFALSASHASGQVASDSLFLGKSTLFYQNEGILNPWIYGSNPASLKLLETGKMSRVQVTYDFAEEQIRRAMNPGLTNAVGALTQSRQTMGKAMVSGSFGYQNQHYNDLLYNGNMDFSYRNLYMLGDTIGGKQRQEGYFFDAVAAYPFLSGRLLAGIGMEYNSRIGAKMKDLRNLNTITHTKINPGLIWRTASMSFGISGGPVIENNLTHVTAELDDRHTLFYHMGMGHYSASRNFNQAESVRYEGRGFEAGVQMSVQLPSWSSFHAVRYSKLTTEARVGNTFRLINGMTDYDKLSYHGSLLLRKPKHLHEFQLTGSMTTLNATEIRQESYSQSIDGVYYTLIRTLRWIEGKHIVRDYSGSLQYQLSSLGQSQPLRYQFTASAGAGYYGATHYPAEIYGYYNATSAIARLKYQHFIKAGSINMDPYASAGAKIVVDKDAVFKPFPNYLASIPELDYRYFSEDFYQGTLGLNLSTRTINFKGVSQFFADVSGSYMLFPNINQDNHNVFLRVSVGAIF